jgi:hypothetical protein
MCAALGAFCTGAVLLCTMGAIGLFLLAAAGEYYRAGEQYSRHGQKKCLSHILNL